MVAPEIVRWPPSLTVSVPPSSDVEVMLKSVAVIVMGLLVVKLPTATGWPATMTVAPPRSPITTSSPAAGAPPGPFPPLQFDGVYQLRSPPQPVQVAMEGIRRGSIRSRRGVLALR
jgi:hypothetical protein